MSDEMEDCEGEYRWSSSEDDDESVGSYDSDDWRTSDPDGPGLIPGRYIGT
jgi:hypothetical protein